MIVEFAVRSEAMPGECVSGDRCRLVDLGARALLAVADGMGHGKAAGDAAEIALGRVAENAGLPLERIIRSCGAVDMQGRGATLSIALFDAANRQLHWLGIGDVAGVFCRAASGETTMLVPRPGFIGEGAAAERRHSIARPAEMLSIEPGDLVLLATDGIDPRFAGDVPALRSLSLEEIVGELLSRFRRPDDDALIAAARLAAGDGNREERA